MSTKFEQLLDFLVNEEMDKANELFHDIVVEKSRDIYENLIAEEDAEDEEMDESAEDDEEEMDESAEELEDSYSMEADDEEGGEFGGDATDDMLGDVEADEFGDESEEGAEGGENQAIFDIKNAIADLEAAFAELEQSQGQEASGEEEGGFGDEETSDFDDEESEEETDEMMGFMEGRRVTREYVEKVGNDWEKNSQKTQGQYAGASTGDKDGAPQEGKSPISSGKGKPNTGATAANIVAKSATSDEDGTSPKGKVGGLVKSGGKFTGSGTHNVDNVKSGIKTLGKVTAGHGAERKGGAAGPVGSGTGDKAGQTSVSPSKPFLKKL